MMFKKKWIKVTMLLLIVPILFLVALLSFSQSIINLQFRYSDQEILEKFPQYAKVDVEHFSIGERPMRSLVRLNSENDPWIIFVHGAPGSCTDYLKYFQDSSLSSRFNMLTIDRPGYGYSGFGKSETSIEEQAAFLHEIVTSKNTHDITLVGHSYGGPVVARMAIDYPSYYDKVIMLAPAIDPDHEKMFGISKLACWKLTRWIVPRAWRVAADEKFSHAEELTKMIPLWQDIAVKTIHVHGDSDVLVPFENLAFAEQMFEGKDNFVSMPLAGVNHFLPWSHYELVKELILQE